MQESLLESPVATLSHFNLAAFDVTHHFGLSSPKAKKNKIYVSSQLSGYYRCSVSGVGVSTMNLPTKLTYNPKFAEK